jgi:hypothetical protein
MEYLIILIVVAVLGNFIIRKVVARVDREPIMSENVPADSQKLAAVKSEDVLRAWGRRADSPAVQIAGPIHPAFVECLQEYETIGPDKHLRVLDRPLVAQPFNENTAFTQIGVWGDGSEVLVRRDAADGRVYLAEIEDATPDRPELLADSLEEYLCKAWLYDQDSRE